MSCMSLGTIDKSLITILIGCIFCFLNRLLSKCDSLLYEYPILSNICISISRLLAVIPYIIFKIKLKQINKRPNTENSNNKLIELIYNDSREQVNARDIWKYLLLSTIVYLAQTIFLAKAFKIKTNSWILYILFTALFFYSIFKIKLYRHHYLSCGLIILMGLIIDLILGNLQSEIIEDPINLVMKFLKDILTSLYLVLAKYIMEKKYISVYGFSFYMGFFSLIILLIVVIFDYYFFKWTDYNNYFSNFDYKELLIVLGVIFTQLVINLTTLFTTKYNSPCHVFIILVFGQLAYYIDFKDNAPLVIAFLIIILFLSLIFNEIIEVNLCGLSYNTKKNISKRAENEMFINNDTFEENFEDNENLKELNNKEGVGEE